MSAELQVLVVSQCEAARLLGVERTTIWRMWGRGELARVRIGRRTLITMASVYAFIASQVESARDDQRRLTCRIVGEVAVDIGDDHDRRVSEIATRHVHRQVFSSAVVA